jgi:hypothetical protein
LPPKKRAAKKNGSSFFVVCVPSLHTVAPFVRRGYCVFFSTIFFFFSSVENFQLKKNSPKKSTATCVLAVAQPPAINLNRNARKGLIL